MTVACVNPAVPASLSQPGWQEPGHRDRQDLSCLWNEGNQARMCRKLNHTTTAPVSP